MAHVRVKWQKAEKMADQASDYLCSMPDPSVETWYRMGQFESYLLENDLHYTDANDSGITFLEYKRCMEDKLLSDQAGTMAGETHNESLAALAALQAAEKVVSPLQKAVRYRETAATVAACRRRIAELQERIALDEA